MAHLAQRFEEGPIDPTTGKRIPRTLKRDQTLFLTKFADACNATWDDGNNDVPWERRQTFRMLLMG